MKLIAKVKRLKGLMQMNLQKYASYTTGDPIDGFAVTFELDWKCNARCSFCKRWKKTDFNVLSKDEYFKLIDDINDSGGKKIALSGGEPLLRKDIFDIIQYANSKDMFVDMNTNGLLLPKLADRIIEAKVDGVIVSIHNADPGIHNAMAGVRRCFERALEGTRKLGENGIDVVIGGIITTSTFNDMKDLIDLAVENKAKIRFQAVHDELSSGLFLTNKNLTFSDYSEEDIDEKINEMISYYESKFGQMSWVDKVYYRLCPVFLKNPQEFLSIKCTAAARTRYHIGPEGNVFPCGPLREDIKFGNVRNQSFKQIINSTKATHFRKRVLSDRKCVCWWRCEALPLIADQFIPLPPIMEISAKKWEKIINKLKGKACLSS